MRFDQTHTDLSCVCVSHTQMWLAWAYTPHVYAWTRLFDWLCASMFVSRECVFERRYLRAAGSPKASTLHPWPGSTGALSSLSRLTWNWREEDRHCCHSSHFYLLFFVSSFHSFVLNQSKKVTALSNLSLFKVYHQSPSGLIIPPETS